jgi:transcription initiation factor IIE alpha subunit
MTINLDQERVYIACPRCQFPARPFLRQIRYGETVVCGGCKGNLRLVDHMGTFRQAQTKVTRAIEDLARQLSSIKFNLKI